MTDIKLLNQILIQIMDVPDRCIEEIQRNEDGNILCKYTCGKTRLSCLGAEFKDYEISYKILDWIRDIELKENK